MTNIAVIGAGYWGKNLVRNFAELGVLSHICDKDEQQANKLAKEHGATVASWQDVINNDSIDGVVIATPAATHAILAKEAILAGKDVFVEKPIALNIDDAIELCELSDKHKCILMVGHLLRFHPAFTMLKNLVDDGKLGRLQYIYSNRLNLGKIRQEEDILWSFAPHDISMILSLMDAEPESVYATGGCFLHKTIADVTTTHLSFSGGQQAHIFVSWLHPFKQQKMVVVGDKGMATFDDSEDWDNKLLLYPHEINWKKGNPIPTKADAQPIPLTKEEPLKNECNHFIDCIKTRKIPKTNGWDALQVLRVLDKASDSLKLDSSPRRTDSTPFYAHESATIDSDVSIGKGSKIWHYSHIVNNTSIGQKCTIGQNVMIGPDVTIGNQCKIQNNVSIYKGVTLEDNVFCGPSCVFTNVNFPRADINRQDEFDNTYVEEGVTIGANATIVCGTRLGARSFIGAGAVVTKNVPAHALMVGNPAKQIGWVSHSGEKLDESLTCPRDGTKYKVNDNNELEQIT